MPIIYVPTFAFFKKDVETMLGILEKEVPNGFGMGLEIGGRPEHFGSKENLEKIAENIKSVAKGAEIVVHGFSGLEVYEINGEPSDIANMATEKGKNLLMTYIDLAKKVGSHYVHVHGSAGYRGIRSPKDKQEILMKIRKNLLEGLSQSGEIKIGIENLPSPSACDFNSDPETVWSDYVEQPTDCLRIVDETNLKFTFDTSHYGIGRNWHIDLVEPAKMLGNHLNHVHAVDCSGYWQPCVSKAYDGSIPGDGRIGRDSFENFFKYIMENHQGIGICLEIRPADLKEPSPEYRESIKRVCNWLK